MHDIAGSRMRRGSLRRMRDWLVRDALPLWAERGLDRAGGGFVERLTHAGRQAPDDYKRVVVQARQVHVFSQAHLLGWRRGARRAADHGLAFLLERCRHREGGFIHRTTRDGAALDPLRDTYDHAFILTALAWHLRAFGDERVLGPIDDILSLLDGALRDPAGRGYAEGLPPSLPRRQNPHMHLFEACMALHEATGAPRHLDRAREILALLDDVFLDPGTGALAEFYDAGWRVAPGRQGAVVEPGHQFEWVWLLHRYAGHTGADVSARAEALYRAACSAGLDADGLAFDAVLRDGTVHVPTKRLWPQTEALKAHVAQGAWARAEALAGAIFARYLETVPAGLWQDRIDRDGAGLADASPASTFYHLFLAFTEAMAAWDDAGDLSPDA